MNLSIKAYLCSKNGPIATKFTKTALKKEQKKKKADFLAFFKERKIRGHLHLLL